MQLEPERGTYSIGVMTVRGSFRLNGSGAPTVFRDGTMVQSSGKQFSVTRVSTGLYEVTFIAGFPLPIYPFITTEASQSATPTNHIVSSKVVGTWDASARKFRILCRLMTSGAASDGDANDRVTFVASGSFVGPGIDPA